MNQSITESSTNQPGLFQTTWSTKIRLNYDKKVQR